MNRLGVNLRELVKKSEKWLCFGRINWQVALFYTWFALSLHDKSENRLHLGIENWQAIFSTLGLHYLCMIKVWCK